MQEPNERTVPEIIEERIASLKRIVRNAPYERAEARKEAGAKVARISEEIARVKQELAKDLASIDRGVASAKQELEDVGLLGGRRYDCGCVIVGGRLVLISRACTEKAEDGGKGIFDIIEPHTKELLGGKQ